jgi:FkbM family methyltransferase
MPIVVRPRPGKEWGDEYVIAENLRRRQYFRHGLTATRDDIWLDAGGHIGTFALSIAEQVRHVYSYEPEPDNYAALVDNVLANHMNLQISAFRGVLVGNDDMDRLLYVNQHRNSGSHTTRPVRGRPAIAVPAYNINAELARTHANKLKMDVEGAEAELLPALTQESLNQLDAVVFEYHNNTPSAKGGAQYTALLALMKRNFAQVYAPTWTPGRWLMLVWAMKDKETPR